MQTVGERTWWSRPGLDVRDGRLRIAGVDAETIARSHATPLLVHDLERIGEQADALRAALVAAGLDVVIRLAIKAQRESDVLRFLRRRVPWLGIDACSPGEVRWALEHGWRAEEISYTGTNVADRDLDVLADAGVHVNVDLLSQLERVGRRMGGATVGVRVNPRIGAGYADGDETLYAGGRPTKFGLVAERLPQAVARAADLGLTIDTVHVHVGDGYLDDGLPVFRETLRRVAAMTQTLQGLGCPIREVNTGGGLGVPQRAGDRPLDLDRWAAAMADELGALGVTVSTEPGDFLTKECGVLLAEVITVEDRDGHTFAGLDAGWHQICHRFIYGEHLEIVSCAAADAPATDTVTITGNINEGNDVFAEDRALPALTEGDVVAILNVGSYGASMASEHCLRPPAAPVFLAERAP